MGPELPTLGGALLGGVAFVAILGWVHRDHPPTGAADQSGSMPMSLPGAAMPYLAFIIFIAGCATIGLTGQEGAVLRKTLPACMSYVLLGGMLVLLVI